MVAAHYFFSTLAQASAAIVGILIAVAAVLYSLERQRVERRTEEYRDSLTEFRNRYGFALMTLDSMLEDEGGKTTHQMTDDLSIDNEKLKQLIYEEYDEYQITSLFLAHTRRILGIFNRIGPEKDNVLSDNELDTLNRSITWLYSHCHYLNDKPDSTILEFVQEVTGKPVSAHDETANLRIFGNSDDPQGYHAFQLEGWFEERKMIESEILRPRSEMRETGDTSVTDELQTGDNFWSLKNLVEYLMSDFRRVLRRSSGTVVDYESGIRPVIKVSTYLLFVGVTVPTMFLFSVPIVLPEWSILVSQILLLSGTIILSLTLIEFVLQSAKPTSKMGDEENLSRFSSTIVKLLPDLPV